ncbi:solute carrier family 15 member 1-like [Aphidius gifuensis]|nr:solute carrier family 15 member 1-like [Aphidius gifuensis]
MEDQTGQLTKVKYPKSIFFIIANEFCERFSFFGIRTILWLFVSTKLGYSENVSLSIYHSFSMLVYFFPLMGAILADSLLGRFKTIFYLSIIYSVGQMILSASTVPDLGLPIRESSLIGLFLIALGAGGIKPCVAAFGADQFVLPQQSESLKTYFSMFYCTVNIGGVISAVLTTEIRSRVKCYGEEDCYFIAFLIPTVLMGLSIIIFGLGRPLYKVKKPEGNVVLNVIKCIFYSISKKINYNQENRVEREHWLDHADDKYDKALISDIKAALKVLVLFVPLPMFWALYDQQGSTWTEMANYMDCQIGSFRLGADQMQIMDPILLVCFIPIFQTFIYPMFARVRLLDTPLKKMTTGGFLAAIAFLISAVVQFQLDTTYPAVPSTGFGQLRIVNPQNCMVPMTINGEAFNLEPYGVWNNIVIEIDEKKTFNYTANFESCGNPRTSSGKIDAIEGQALSYVIEPNNYLYKYNDNVKKTKNSNPAMRVLVYNSKNDSPTNVTMYKNGRSVHDFKINGTMIETAPAQASQINEFEAGTYQVYVNGQMLTNEIIMKIGGVYTLIVDIAHDSKDPSAKLLTIRPPNSMHVLWLIPQYIILAMAEVLFAVTGLEFAFTQAPGTMKSLLQASWVLTTAIGNLLVSVISAFKLFNSKVYEAYFYVVLMVIAMSVFTLMTRFYEYADSEKIEETEEIQSSSEANDKKK